MQLLRKPHDATRYAPLSYALALWRVGTRRIERHVRSQAASCLFSSLSYDVVGALEDTDAFTSLLGLREWPHLHSNSAPELVGAVRTSSLDCVTREAVYQAYQEDFQLARWQQGASPVARTYASMRCTPQELARELAQLREDSGAEEAANFRAYRALAKKTA